MLESLLEKENLEAGACLVTMPIFYITLMYGMPLIRDIYNTYIGRKL